MISWPIFAPQDSSNDLAKHAHTVILFDGATGPVYPQLCPNCGKTATAHLAVKKVFRQTSTGDDVTTYLVQEACVPYCESCIALHHHEQRVLSPFQCAVVSLATGLAVSAVGCSFMALLFLPSAMRDLGRPGFPLLMVVVGFFALIAYSSFTGAWRQNAYRRVPPQTSVTLAFDFGERHAPLFERSRSAYAIRDAKFAQAFKALNSLQLLS